MLLPTLVLLPILFGGALCILAPENKVVRYLILLGGQALSVVVYILTLFSGGGELTLFSLPGGLRFFLSVDKMGLFFAGVGSAVFLIAEWFAVKYMDKEEHPNRFAAFLLFSAGAFYGLCFSGNLLTFYFFFELTTLLTFPLVLHEQTEKALLGAKKYLFYSIGGAILALGGIVLFLTQGGEGSSFAEPAAVLSTPGLVGVFMIILGLSAKAGMFPLQAWLPAAHPVCPAPASALLSGLVVKAGVLGILRVAYFSMDPAQLQGSVWQTVLLILACITVVCGSTMAFFEPLLKRRLAYSTVSNLSYILMGLFLFSEAGLEGALLHVLAHAAAKTALFLCAGEMIFRSEKTTVGDLKGLGKKMPMPFVLFLLAALSLVGIPPFGGFLSKWTLCVAAVKSAPGAFAYILPGCLLLSALLTAGYLFKPVISAFFEKEEGEVAVEKGSFTVFTLPVLLLCLAGLAIGLCGTWISTFIGSLF